MIRDRHIVTVSFEIDHEMFPGWGHDPQDFADSAARAIKEVLESYNPKILSTKVDKFIVPDAGDPISSVLNYLTQRYDVESVDIDGEDSWAGWRTVTFSCSVVGKAASLLLHDSTGRVFHPTNGIKFDVRQAVDYVLIQTG